MAACNTGGLRTVAMNILWNSLTCNAARVRTSVSVQLAALDVSRRCALQIYILLTYLLTTSSQHSAVLRRRSVTIGRLRQFDTHTRLLGRNDARGCSRKNPRTRMDGGGFLLPGTAVAGS